MRHLNTVGTEDGWLKYKQIFSKLTLMNQNKNKYPQILIRLPISQPIC